MLELKNVSKIYKTKSQDVRALDGIDLYFEETGLVFVTGKSGSGKTTLLNVIGGLDNFDEGEILIKDKSTSDFSKSDYDSYRNTYVGFIFQEYNLLDNLTIYKNLSLATELQGKKDNKEQVEKILAKVDLKDISSRHPQQLSGGQKQRVAIARALIKNPSIIMADEPTGALDTENGLQIMALLKKLSKDKLVIVVSHDLELANKFADRIINMKDGKVESDITIKTNSTHKTNLVEKKNILSIRRGAKLKSTDLQKIKTAVEAGKDVHVTDNIDVIKKQTKIEKKKVYEKSSPFIKTHLGFWDTVKLGLNTLKSKRIRLAITIILCALAFSIFGIFDSMAIYDEGRLATNTIKSSITPSVTMQVNESSAKGSEINIGTTLMNSLSAQTGYNIKGVYNSYYVGTSNPTEFNDNTYYSISKYYYSQSLRGVVEFDQKDLNEYKFTIVDGRLPQEYDEIAVSEYFAYCMVNWGYTYKNADKEIIKLTKIDDIINEENPLPLTIGTSNAKETYKIVGIIKTGTINKKFDKLKENFDNASNMDQNEFKNYIKNSYNLYAFVKPGFADYAVSKYNTLNKFISNIYNYELSTQDEKISTSINTFYTFDSLEKLISDKYADEEFNPYFFLDETATELSGNEIMVSINQFQTLYSDIINSLKSFAENSYTIYPQLTGYKTEIEYKLGQIDKLKQNTKENSQTKVTYLNDVIKMLEEIQAIKDLENGTTRSESILQRSFKIKKTDSGKGTQIYKLEDDTYKIVGFYTGVVTDSKSFITSNEGISNLGITLMQGPYSSFLATNTGRGSAKNLSKLLLYKNGICYTCADNAIAMINTNSDFFSELSLLFLIASAVFAVFSIVMFSNFISTSIKNKYGEIGILRALGARGVDILKMFVVEAFAIALINAVCACIIAGVGCIFVNMFLSTYLNIYIPLAAFGIRQILVIIALSIGVGIVSAILPIASVSKQKPVETIRKAF